jgi:hypothetical protein
MRDAAAQRRQQCAPHRASHFISDREPSSLPVHNHTDGTSGTDT